MICLQIGRILQEIFLILLLQGESDNGTEDERIAVTVQADE